VAKENTEARGRMVLGAADMIRRRGLAATSIRELAKHAGAPLGSTYHYFPGGKRQLATEAVRVTGDTVTEALRRELEAGPVEGLHTFLEHWKSVLISTDFQAGCPLLAVAVESGGDDDMQDARTVAAEVFTTWRTLLARSLRAHGVKRTDADRLAALIVTATEGAIALCRAQRSTEPLEVVAHTLDDLVRSAIS